MSLFTGVDPAYLSLQVVNSFTISVTRSVLQEVRSLRRIRGLDSRFLADRRDDRFDAPRLSA